MNSKKAKGLRKFARKVIANSAKPLTDVDTMYKKMKKAYKQAKGGK